MRKLAEFVGVLAMVAMFAAGAPALAQQTPAPDSAAAQAQRELVQPGNNAPVWGKVRSGAPGYTTVQGIETGVLVQSRGQTWREARVPIAFWGGLLVAAALAGLAIFYAIRGPMGDVEKPGARMIRRFSPADRYAHWLLAICWTILAVTGLVISFGKDLLLPVIGYTLFAWIAVLFKNLHNFVGPILIIAVPWMFFQYVRDNGISAADFKWFGNIFGYFRGKETPSKRFNAGEKIVFWLILVILTTALVITGVVLNFPNYGQGRSVMQNASMIHMIAAYIAMSLAAVHIYLGTIGVRNAYSAMRHGEVSEHWAEHHHKLWYEEVKAGKAQQKFADEVEKPATGEARTQST